MQIPSSYVFGVFFLRFQKINPIRNSSQRVYSIRSDSSLEGSFLKLYKMNHIQHRSNRFSMRMENHYPESSSVIASPTWGSGDGSSSLQDPQIPHFPSYIADAESLLEHLTSELKRLLNVGEYSSAATTPCLPANTFSDGLSSQRLQGPQSIHSLTEKQVSEHQSHAIHGTTSDTGSHNSSFRYNTRRSNGSYGSNIHNNVNGGPHHHYGRNFHRAPGGWLPPPPTPPRLQPPGPQYFPEPLVMPPMQPCGFPYGFARADLGYRIPYHDTQLPPHPPNPCIGAAPNESFVGATYYVGSKKDYSVNVLTSSLDVPHEIVKQVNYYFSIDNLAKDIYLRKQMDHEAGWVPITLIAGFPRMKRLTYNLQIIANALQASSVVEISDDDKKIRRRGDWERWILR